MDFVLLITLGFHSIECLKIFNLKQEVHQCIITVVYAAFIITRRGIYVVSSIAIDVPCKKIKNLHSGESPLTAAWQ